jgi:hypothetical protein
MYKNGKKINILEIYNKYDKNENIWVNNWDRL